MRVIFAGTPEFSLGILTALVNSKHNVVGVYCQPDRPKGRGQVLSACPVKQRALAYNLKILHPEHLKSQETQNTLKNLGAEVMVVAAYGQLLPKSILTTPKYGCLNVHASLLPRWRGAAPIQHAILAGDKTTGVSIMQMDEGLDTGGVLLKQTCAIADTDSAQTLHNKLSILGANAIIKVLEDLPNLSPVAQNNKNATYAKKLNKQDAWIDWGQSAQQINQQIRAFNPYPIAQTYATSDKFKNKVLRILSASVIATNNHKQPGDIISLTKGTCYVATGNGLLSLEQVQLAGRKKSNIKDFNNAYTLTKLGESK